MDSRRTLADISNMENHCSDVFDYDFDNDNDKNCDYVENLAPDELLWDTLFAQLRSLIPTIPKNSEISTLELLKRATEYISFLKEQLYRSN
uniref:BHLH domain-containing protein n=1 Tax=Romanomermis culicivorax TaxID=13658 RepID=A0A915K2I8_ROMCU